MSDLVLTQDLFGGSRVIGELGSGRFDLTKGGLYLAEPNFACTNQVDGRHHLRSLSLPVAQWQTVLDEASDGQFTFDIFAVHCRPFHSLVVRSLLRKLWSLCDEEGPPSRLVARAAPW